MDEQEWKQLVQWIRKQESLQTIHFLVSPGSDPIPLLARLQNCELQPVELRFFSADESWPPQVHFLGVPRQVTSSTVSVPFPKPDYQSLRPHWDCTYFLVRQPGYRGPRKQSLELATVRVTSENLDLAQQVYQASFGDKHHAQLDPERIRAKIEAVRTYALRASDAYVLLEAETPVALFLGDFSMSPWLSEETFHIGYLGIIQSASRITRLKAHRTLAALLAQVTRRKDIQLTCRIHPFNEDSLSYALRFGACIRAIELKR